MFYQIHDHLILSRLKFSDLISGIVRVSYMYILTCVNKEKKNILRICPRFICI